MAAVAATRGRSLRRSPSARRRRTTASPAASPVRSSRVTKVVITEDTVTRGTSSSKRSHVVRELGAEPVMVLVVVDRGGTCAAMAEAEGVGFHALVTAPDLGFDYEGA